MKTALKVMIAVLVIGLLAVLVVRSARSSLAEPFTVAQQDLAGWTLALAPENNLLDALLWITPHAALMPPVTNQLFDRMGQSLHYPPHAVPVVLRSEFQRAMAGAVTPQELLDAARDAGLGTATFQPRCMAQRHTSTAGQGIYFLLFDIPPFTQFREQIARRLQAAGRDPLLFEPAALSPVLIAAGLEGSFTRWLPLRADPEDDCFAPLVAE